MLDEDSIVVDKPPMRFSDAYFLSVETFTTVGYGALRPQTHWGHWVMTIETYVAICWMTIFGGIMFTRVSIPTLHIYFSSKFIIRSGPEGGVLLIRLVNMRPISSWFDVQANVSVLVQKEDHRRMIPLSLVEQSYPVLHATWTLAHRIDKD